MNISSTTIRQAYERTSAKSPLRRVLVAGLCQFSDEDDIVDEDLPAEFLVDMVKYLQRRVRESHQHERPVFTIPSPCEFHGHESTEDERECRQHRTW